MFLLTSAQKNIFSQILKVLSSAWFAVFHNIYRPVCHEWSSFANKEKEQWINPVMRMGIIFKFSRVLPCAKYVIYWLTQKGKKRTSNWVKRHGFPHYFFCTRDVWLWANHLVLCGSVYLSVYLEFHHLPFVIHRDAAGANSIMHVKVLCKMKSHWLFNIIYLPAHAKPCFLQHEGGQEVTEKPNHHSGGVGLSHYSNLSFVTRKQLHLQIV